MTYVIAVYEINRAYGGPEEGGWYYDTGKLVRVLGTRSGEEAAYSLASRLNGWMERMQRNKRSISSVLYSGGCYSVEAHLYLPPACYPETKPYYS